MNTAILLFPPISFFGLFWYHLPAFVHSRLQNATRTIRDFPLPPYGTCRLQSTHPRMPCYVNPYNVLYSQRPDIVSETDKILTFFCTVPGYS